MFALIVALARNKGIGRANRLPWSRPLRTDMSWFRTLSQSIPLITSHHIDLLPSPSNAVVMGRKTWESIPPKFRPLPNRMNIVLSRRPGAKTENAFFIPTFEDLSHLDIPPSSMIFVIGGHDIYNLAIQNGKAQIMFVTEVFESPDCDVFFPHVDWESYEKRDITYEVSRLIDQNLADAFYNTEANAFTENGTTFKMFIYIKPGSL
ncbi:dihydrofolate reductase [Encephalitozoon romaleae SJ-2008]|uniref:Dihydrofolate reductase n=1 Tax=Encephalitozoon romaleae (strain SJ-2008) TaxID=1178016 RepID=I7AQ83_ENCRO|nr:dihydrofolate reductase [Encephalitozoon romaleae SJ-2008]AFN82472.1 dihydrofolate reductase [Encephalitozoon romaleae SJ-2008]